MPLNPRAEKKTGRTRAAIVAAALIAAALVSAPAENAVAAPALDCIDTLYLTNSADGSVREVDLASGTTSTTPAFPLPVGVAPSANQLGIGAGGATALYGTRLQIVTYDAPAGAATLQSKPAGVAQGTVGAVNPKTGLYYYGAYIGGTLRLFVYDPATAASSTTPATSVTVVAAPGTNGDIAFDKAGRLYFVAASATAYTLYVADGVVPIAGDGSATGVVMTSTPLTSGTTATTTNGIAFASDGHLYVGEVTGVQKANPITGAPVGTLTALTGVTSTDLGSCANPSTLEVASTFPDGKRRPTDTTTIIVEGGSYGAPETGPDFTPSTVNPDGSSSTAAGVVLPGETYTVRQVGDGTTNLADYTTTWACRDLEGTVVASGTGNTAGYRVPTGTDGTSVACAFTNELRPPTALPDTAAITFTTPSVTLPGATDDTPGNGAILPALTVFTDPAATDGGRRLETAEGVWTIGADGRITFAPAPGYSGTTPAVGYRITDDNGLSSTSTATVTVAPGPTATPDTASTPQATPVDVTPLGNDTAGRAADGSAGTISPTTLRFPTAGQPAGSSVSADARTLTVPGEGVYVIDPATGAVRFTPEPTFFGTAQPVAYSFTDSVGTPAGSTITITVTERGPTAFPDTANTPFDTPVTIDVLDDDAAGPGGRIDPARTVFTSPSATDGGTRLTTAEGSWTVDTAGAVVFTPADGYSGTTPPIEYRITDDNGQSATSTVTVTVRPGPAATADATTTPQNVDVAFPLLRNDTPGRRTDGSAGAFDPASVQLIVTPGLPAGSAVSADGRRLTVPGEGVYTFAPATGRVTFDPEPRFTGAATPIGYEVDDDSGNTTSSTISVTVTPVMPVLIDDAVKTPGGVPIVFDPLANDRPGAASAPLDPRSAIFTSPDATDDGKALTTPEGRWTISDDGRVRFAPAPGFEGVTVPVEYRVRDENGTTARAEVSVTVGRPALAAPDSATTRQGQPVGVPLLTNDRASDLGAPCDPGSTTVPAGCDSGELLPASVLFPPTGQPSGSVVSGDGRTLTVPGEGVYTIDPATGIVTFVPEPRFTGPATAVSYAVADTNGAAVSSTVTIIVTPVSPIAADDAGATPFDTPVVIDLLSNDGAGDALTPLVPARTAFPADGQPAGVIVSADGRSLTFPSEGTYVLSDGGSTTFTPAPGFTGTTTAVTYRIEDANGTTATATVAVTVRPGPVAERDRGTTSQGIAITVSPLDNDTPSRDADDSAGAWDDASLAFPVDRQPAGATVSDSGKTLTVPGQGAYTIAANGDVTFQPEPAFSGTASPIIYAVTDENGNTASSTIAITVTAVTPTATDDASTTPYGTPVTFDIVGNDVAGDTAVPLVVDSAVFEASGIPDGLDAEIRDAGTTLEIAGQGTFTLNDDGTVTFTPADGFSGATTPVRYTISDANGSTATAALVVTVQPGPTLVNDVDRTPQNTPVTVDVLVNDRAGLDADGERGTLDPTSVVFPADAQTVGTVGDGGRTLTVPGQGVYRIDPATGAVTFAPDAQFRGEATPVVYAVTDSLGTTATATVTITVQGLDPVARDDSATTTPGAAVTIDVLADDSGATGAPLDPTTLKLVSGDGTLVDSLTVPGEGTWRIVDGKLVFTPLPDFRGRTTPVTYSVADINGSRATAQVVVTVGALPATGAEIPWVPIGGGIVLLLAGLALLIARRRRTA
jgi:LPXTG-motif cell wall-anchored protein